MLNLLLGTTSCNEWDENLLTYPLTLAGAIPRCAASGRVVPLGNRRGSRGRRHAAVNRALQTGLESEAQPLLHLFRRHRRHVHGDGRRDLLWR